MNVTIYMNDLDETPIVLKDIAQAAPAGDSWFVTQPRGMGPTFWNNDELAKVEIELDVGDQMLQAEIQAQQAQRPAPKY